MQRFISIMLVFVGLTAGNPVKTITGTVTDPNGTGIRGVNVQEKGTSNQVVTDRQGRYRIAITRPSATLVFSSHGLVTKRVRVGNRTVVDVVMVAVGRLPEDVPLMDRAEEMLMPTLSLGQTGGMMKARSHSPVSLTRQQPWFEQESYQGFEENGFKKPLESPLSTFSIDVDVASYSNVRRFLNNGQRPPVDAVRIEEMINYFDYDYPQPTGKVPFSVTTRYTKAPWNKDHLLVQIGLQGKKIEEKDLPASNLVFLLDVSGSMSNVNKLPLLVSSLKMLVNRLRPQDQVSIVVYAGAAGLVLEPTPGDNKQKIIEALGRLQAGGSTAGGAGIELAYKVAAEHFIPEGNNRVILATDGDFNVGASSDEAMEQLIVRKRKEGVFLTVLGFGMGNYKDAKMEILADKGNGNYAYIDNLKEAQKTLVREFGATLFAIAKDVKIQVEFNPAKVQAYRLIGYENRLLRDEDFNNDRKDAGELGSGHTVTALYEVIPTGVQSNFIGYVDPLRYQEKEEIGLTDAGRSDEILTVKLRYKEPEADVSRLLSRVLRAGDRADQDQDLTWAAAVAGFGMLLRGSDYAGEMSYEEVIAMARQARGADEYGYRSEFIQLVRLASGLVQ